MSLIKSNQRSTPRMGVYNMRKIIMYIFGFLILASCEKDPLTIESNDPKQSETGTMTSSKKKKSERITICHKTNFISNGWITMDISSNALAAHLSHGDILPDADHDGYTKFNPCGIGNQNDCNDNNPAINPYAIELSDNSIDDNCNGQIDETIFINICNQVWMLKNLDVSKYRNGDEIPQAVSTQEWLDAEINETGVWCYFLNNTANGPVYGKLYNWYAINDSRGLAPLGWHVPSDEEWTTLYDCLGGASVAGGKMKETGTTHWNSPNEGASNSSGFTSLPGGLRNFDGVFYYIGTIGVWWSATDNGFEFAWSRGNYNISADAGRSIRPKSLGFSVRCVKD